MTTETTQTALAARTVLDARAEAHVLWLTVGDLTARRPAAGAAGFDAVGADLQHALDAVRDAQRHLAAAYMAVKAEELAR